ncbi:hypothetical protein VP01_6075g1, partial [Puccinia sorghi]
HCFHFSSQLDLVDGQKTMLLYFTMVIKFFCKQIIITIPLDVLCSFIYQNKFNHSLKSATKGLIYCTAHVFGFRIFGIPMVFSTSLNCRGNCYLHMMDVSKTYERIVYTERHEVLKKYQKE